MKRRRYGRGAATRAAPPADDVRRVWTSPQVLLALVLLALAAVYALGARRPTVAEPPRVPLSRESGLQLVEREVRYVVVDEEGLERPGFADVALPADAADDRSVRLAAALEALRSDLVETGTWPATVAAPTALVFDLDRSAIAVIDLDPLGADAAVSVAQEWSVVRSLVASARAEVDADDVHLTVAGAPAETVWGHVAPPTPQR